MIKKLLGGITVSMLAGCVAMTPQEIRATSPEQYDSSATVDQAIQCMRTNAADYVQVTSYPGSGAVDFTVETFQMLKTRILYMATVTPDAEGSRVSARFSGQNSLSISQAEFRKLLGTCMPTRPNTAR